MSIVIPAFNEAARLPQSLGHIRAACDASPELTYEIIVCDNNSTDGTSAVAVSAGCRVVFEPENQISRARNTGASAASGDWLLFIDADSWPSAGLVRDMLPLLHSSRCIGGGSTIRVVDGPRWFKVVVESKNWSMRIFKWSLGAFILCRRDAFSEVGGFSQEHYLFEEVDFVKRLKALGARRDQQFVILHRHPFNTSGRRAHSFRLGSLLKFAFQLTFFQKRAVRDRAFAEKWYGGRR